MRSLSHCCAAVQPDPVLPGCGVYAVGLAGSIEFESEATMGAVLGRDRSCHFAFMGESMELLEIRSQGWPVSPVG